MAKPGKPGIKPGTPKRVVDPNAIVYVPGIGKIKASEYSKKIAESKRPIGPRREEKYLEKVKLFLTKMANIMKEQSEKGYVPRVWTKTLRQINKEVKEELKTKAGVSIVRLLNEHFIERVTAEHSRPVYVFGTEGAKLLGLEGIPVEEHISEEHVKAVSKGIEELAEEE